MELVDIYIQILKEHHPSLNKSTKVFLEIFLILLANKAILESLKEVDTKGKSKDEIKELVCEKQLTDKMVTFF